MFHTFVAISSKCQKLKIEKCLAVHKLFLILHQSNNTETYLMSQRFLHDIYVIRNWFLWEYEHHASLLPIFILIPLEFSAYRLKEHAYSMFHLVDYFFYLLFLLIFIFLINFVYQMTSVDCWIALVGFSILLQMKNSWLNLLEFLFSLLFRFYSFFLH